MLKNIVLLLSSQYLEKIINSPRLESLKREVEKAGAELFLHDTEFLKKDVSAEEQVFGELCAEETLFIADEQEVLMELQERNCFAIACYHKDVEGILGCTQYAIEDLTDIEWEYLNKVYQRYRGIPWEITQTKRCRIREMGPQDLEDLYEL